MSFSLFLQFTCLFASENKKVVQPGGFFSGPFIPPEAYPSPYHLDPSAVQPGNYDNITSDGFTRANQSKANQAPQNRDNISQTEISITREWVDVNGRRILAKLVNYCETTLTLKRETDGVTSTIPRNLLSKDCSDFLKTLDTSQ